MAKTANKRTNRPAERPCQWQKERAMLADNVRTLGEKGKHDHCDERARLCKKRSWTSRPCCKMKQIFVGSAAQNRCEQFQAAVFSVKHAVFRPCTALIQNKLFRSQHAHLKQIQSIHLDPTKAAHSCCELCTDWCGIAENWCLISPQVCLFICPKQNTVFLSNLKHPCIVKKHRDVSCGWWDVYI